MLEHRFRIVRLYGTVNVKIVYDAECNYKIDNEAAIRTAQLDGYDAVVPRAVSECIRHNKCRVLLSAHMSL